MAGCANQGKGTMATPPNGKSYVHPDFHPSGTRGDDGWFYNQYATFNSKRPFVENSDVTMNTVIAEVIPDTVFTSGTISDPTWDATKQYGDPEHGKTFNYNSRQYEFIGYWSKGEIPSEKPSVWKDLGPYGTSVITVGGSVWNDNIYYPTGSSVVHTFNPKPIAGYGIGKITVNGDSVGPTDHIKLSNIAQNYKIAVKFVKGGDSVTINHKSNGNVHGKMFTLSGNSLTLNQLGTAELFTMNGRKILSASGITGQVIPFAGIASGTYLVRIRSTQNMITRMISIQ